MCLWWIFAHFMSLPFIYFVPNVGGDDDDYDIDVFMYKRMINPDLLSFSNRCVILLSVKPSLDMCVTRNTRAENESSDEITGKKAEKAEYSTKRSFGIIKLRFWLYFFWC